jgi:glucose/arabinose dehydrogenase
MPATGGASGTGAVDAGATDAGDGGDATDAGVDAGGDAGAPATVCSAPTTIATPGNTCPGGAPPGLQATLLMGGFSYPVFVTHAPGDATRLFVVERGGTIVIVDMNGTNKRTFLDISTPVVSGSGNDERGLLGLAFHPDYPSDPRFFVNYTGGAVSLSTYVESYEATSPDEADPNSDVSIHSFTQPEGNHNGGMVAFGPDGCLYVGTGDGGGADDLHSSAGCPMGNGQCLSTSLGKILRIDVDDPSARPPGNMASPAQRHVWDYGLRNPWRFSFDRATGDLYIGDVGQGTLEEVDVEPKGAGNLNYGWRIAEGSGCRPGGGGCDLSGLVPPVDEYGHSSGNDCIVGGYVYRGSAISGLQGWYLYGDNGSNRVWAFVWDGNGRCNDSTADLTSQLSLSGDLTSFGEDANGELYMTTITGNLYRIDAM